MTRLDRHEPVAPSTGADPTGGPNRVRRDADVLAAIAEDRGRVFAALVARFRDFDVAEEALADATERALATWRDGAILRNPGGWLMTVATRRAIDIVRRRRTLAARLAAHGSFLGPAPAPEADDPAARSAPAVGEAIRLTRVLAALMPDEPEVVSLLALMLLQHSRRFARCDPDGTPVRLDEQDRAAWDRAMITEGLVLLRPVVRRRPIGRYRLQAAIAAVHAESASASATDWTQIAALYGELTALDSGPVVALNRAIAVGMAEGLPSSQRTRPYVRL